MLLELWSNPHTRTMVIVLLFFSTVAVVFLTMMWRSYRNEKYTKRQFIMFHKKTDEKL